MTWSPTAEAQYGYQQAGVVNKEPEAISFESARNKLARYGYPSEIIDLINQFSNIAYEQFSGSFPGILLVGSTARGELSWIKGSNGLKLFSDIEFLIAVTKLNKQKQQQFHELVARLESTCSYGNLFHIDFTVIPWKNLARLDKKLFIFESKQCGIDIGTRSVSEKLPIVTRQNINWKELNEVLLHRMNSMLLAMPGSFIESGSTKDEIKEYLLNVAKNALDITTWLHPYESDRLVAGFTGRIADLKLRDVRQLKLGRYFTEDDIGFLDKCLAIRVDPSTEVDTNDTLDSVLALYGKGILYCKEMNCIESDASISGYFASIKLFDEYRFRQKVSSLITLLRMWRKLNLFYITKAAVGARKGIMTLFCYYMLSAANEYLKGSGMCWDYLKIAANELSRLCDCSNYSGDDFAVAWGQLRDIYIWYAHSNGNG